MTETRSGTPLLQPALGCTCSAALLLYTTSELNDHLTWHARGMWLVEPLAAIDDDVVARYVLVPHDEQSLQRRMLAGLVCIYITHLRLRLPSHSALHSASCPLRNAPSLTCCARCVVHSGTADSTLQVLATVLACAIWPSSRPRMWCKRRPCNVQEATATQTEVGPSSRSQTSCPFVARARRRRLA